MSPWSCELWVPIRRQVEDFLTFQAELTLKTKQVFSSSKPRCTLEATRVAGISALCPAAVEGRRHPVAPQRVHHRQRGGLLRGAGHRRPAPDVQYLTDNQGSIKRKYSACPDGVIRLSRDAWYNPPPPCFLTFLQNDAIVQQLAAIFSHCFGPAPLPAVPEMKATLSAQLGKETDSDVHMNAHRVNQRGATNRDGFMDSSEDFIFLIHQLIFRSVTYQRHHRPSQHPKAWVDVIKLLESAAIHHSCKLELGNIWLFVLKNGIKWFIYYQICVSWKYFLA